MGVSSESLAGEGRIGAGAGADFAENNLAMGLSAGAAATASCDKAGVEMPDFSFLDGDADLLGLEEGDCFGERAAESCVGTGAAGGRGASSSLELQGMRRGETIRRLNKKQLDFSFKC
jgi:hypothetical protein